MVIHCLLIAKGTLALAKRSLPAAQINKTGSVNYLKTNTVNENAHHRYIPTRSSIPNIR